MGDRRDGIVALIMSGHIRNSTKCNGCYNREEVVGFGFRRPCVGACGRPVQDAGHERQLIIALSLKARLVTSLSM